MVEVLQGIDPERQTNIAPLKFSYHTSASEKNPIKPINHMEDALCVLENGEGAVIADGMALPRKKRLFAFDMYDPMSKKASALAVNLIGKGLEQCARTNPESLEEIIQTQEALFTKADTQIRTTCPGGATTAAAISLWTIDGAGQAVITSTGDSRIYYIDSRNGELHCLTIDQGDETKNIPQDILPRVLDAVDRIADGNLTQFAGTDIYSYIAQVYWGKRKKMPPDHLGAYRKESTSCMSLKTIVYPVKPEDTLLLMTDGVYGNLTPDEILATGGDPKIILQKAKNLSRFRPAGYDDMTVFQGIV